MIISRTDIYVIASTRGSFDTTNGNTIQWATNLASELSIFNSKNCPGKLAVYIHGVWASGQQAEEHTDRVSLSLRNRGYNVLVMGFNWAMILQQTHQVEYCQIHSKPEWTKSRKTCSGF